MSERFDVDAFWQELSPDAQRCIGVAAVLFVASFDAEHSDDLSEVALRRWLHARRTVFHFLRAIGPNRRQLTEGPDLSTVAIRACRVCGCTEDSACEGGCHWVGPDLCSQCGPEIAANGNGFEFDCTGCGRHIAQRIPLTGDRCVLCLNMPDWFRDAKLRRIFAPDWRPLDA
jgi:hypothetical protein